ncbi:MAG: OmpA family protein [Methylococcaceae bacterium]|jgi:OOP family OmpA-OmpF porin
MNKNLLMALSLAGMASFSAVHADTDSASVDTAAPTEEASAPAASGEFTDDRFYAAPFGTFIQPAGARNAQGGWGAGLALGKVINEYFNVEVRGFWQNLTNNGIPQLGAGYQQGLNNTGTWDHGSTNMTGGTVDLQYYFMRDTFSPYAVFGMGGMNTSWGGSFPGTVNGKVHNQTSKQTSSFIFEAGLGATYELADNFLLRGDVRYRGDTAASNWPGNTDVFNDFLVNMGFVIPFGDKPGAAAAAPVAADACASRDTDADGVNDCDDKCPGTASGTKVDDQGCPIVMELKGVNFHYDSAELTEGAKSVLDGVTEQLVAFPAKKDIEVAGYASFEGKKGKEQHNLHLSQRRSESVAKYLRNKGVTNNLFAKGYGTEYPIADNGTEAGRVKNRRVELRWMGD